MFCRFLLVCGLFIWRRILSSSPQPIRKICGDLVLFQHPSFACFHSGGQATTMVQNFAQEWMHRRHSSFGKLPSGMWISKGKLHSRFCFLDGLGHGYHLDLVLKTRCLFHHRFLPKTKPPTKVALISERYLAGGLSCLLKASLV